MPLPTSRDETFLDGDPISSAFLNALQDAAIAAYSPIRMYSTRNFSNGAATPGAWSLASSGRYIETTADSAFAQVPLDGLLAGRTLIGAEFCIEITGGSPIDVTAEIRRAQHGNGLQSIGFLERHSSANGVRILEPSGTHQIDPAYQYWARLDSGVGADSVQWHAVNIRLA